MPRPRTTKTPAPNSLIASAAVLTNDRASLRPQHNGAQDWQRDAWHFYDCVDPETEILTPEGWVTHDRLSPGMLVRTIDHDTGTTGWEPVLHVVRHEVVDRAMLSIEMRHHSSLTTAGHRWPVLRMGYATIPGVPGTVRTTRTRQWVTSETLGAEDQFITAAPARDLPTVAKYDDALVELVGWFWTEGTIRRNRRTQSVTITQSTTHNPTNCAAIETALDVFCPGGWNRWVNPETGVAQYQLTVGASAALLDAAPGKRVAYEFLLSLTRAQLLLFLDVSMRADGHVPSGLIGQKHPDMLARYEFACILAGRTPHTTGGEGRSRLFDLDRSTVSPRRRHRTETTYTGTVWCPVTPSKSWLARRHGTVFYTGNCIGEFRFGCDWRAAACSRAVLTIEEVNAEGDAETLTEGPEVDALAELFGGDTGQGSMLGTVALHFDVPGETYIVGETVPSDYGHEGTEVDRWSIYSNEELTRDPRTGLWTVDRGDGEKRPLAGPESPNPALVIRLWRSHPRKWVQATSPARAVLPILRQLEGLNKHIAASIDSRLAGAGLLLLPSEMTFQAPPGVEVPPEQQQAMNTANYLLELLTQAMTTAIRDRDSAAAVAPIIAQAPGALLEHVKHITFSTPFDDKVQGLITDYLKRLALGLDMPPEVLLGIGDVNHWSAWQIDESSLKTSIEPTLAAITTGLTERFLYPAVEGIAGKAAVNLNRRIGFDVTALRLRADRSAAATDLHSKLLLSDAALRGEVGFDEGDAPDDEETRRRMLLEIAMSRTSQAHEVAEAALRVFIPDLVVTAPLAPEQKPEQGPVVEPPVPEDTPPPPPVEGPPPGGPPPGPGTPPSAADPVFLAACELLVLRAVERANNRINRRGRRRPIPDDQLDAALVDAWDQVPRTASLLGVDPVALTAALDKYTRGLLRTGEEHVPAVLTRCLGVTRG